MRLPDFEQCLTARLFKKKADLGYTSVHSSLDRQSCKVFTFQSIPFKKRKIWKYPIIYHWKGQRTTPQPKAYFTMLRRIKYNRWPQVCFLTGAIQTEWPCHWSANSLSLSLSLIHYLKCIFTSVFSQVQYRQSGLVIYPLSQVYFQLALSLWGFAEFYQALDVI